GNCRTIGKADMGIVRCCWKLWWMPPGFEEPATGPPTGSMLGRPPDAVACTGSTKATVKPSKTSMSIRWSAMPGDTYAAIPPGKQIPSAMLVLPGLRVLPTPARAVAGWMQLLQASPCHRWRRINCRDDAGQWNPANLHLQ